MSDTVLGRSSEYHPTPGVTQCTQTPAQALGNMPCKLTHALSFFFVNRSSNKLRMPFLSMGAEYTSCEKSVRHINAAQRDIESAIADMRTDTEVQDTTQREPFMLESATSFDGVYGE
jgi:hypothetical protein